MKVLPYPFYNAGWRFLDLRRYGRDHRKILVVDDSVAFVGGYNIGSAYATEWRDTHIRVTGPAVWDLKRAFADFWNLNRRRLLGASARPLLLETAAEWEPQIRVHRNVPRLWMFPIRGMYLEAINRAGPQHLDDPGLLPPRPGLRRRAGGGGASAASTYACWCRLKSNHVVADWISRGYYAQLLRAGVRILRFKDAMVHAKTATIDGSWSTVGTANIDRLSLTGNYEVNVEAIDDVVRPGAGGDLPARPDQLPRADALGVGGTRPPPTVHRGDADAVPAAALSARPRPGSAPTTTPTSASPAT